MHILLIHQAFAALDEPGGTRHHELARYLVSQGHRVTVITSPVSYLTGSRSRQPDSPQEEPGISIRRVAVSTSLHKSFVRRIYAFIAFMVSSFFTGLGVRKVDLVWGTSPPIFQGLTAWALARLKGVPFLFEVRDLWPKFAIAVGVLRNPLLIHLSLWLERFLYRHSDRVVVNSPGYIAHVEENGARRVELVPNGADPEMFNPADKGTTFRTAHRLEGDFIVLYAGAHGMSNDLGVVMHAAGKLENDQPEVRFVFLGDGKEKYTLQEQAAAMHLSNVLFLPPLPKNGMTEALAAADACIAILKPIEEYNTTYPNKVFDYMAAGRPVVLAIDGVIRQVVEDAGCGVFSPPGDPVALAQAVTYLARDPKNARRMGLAGRNYLEGHFSRAVIAQRLLRILESMQAGRKNSINFEKK